MVNLPPTFILIIEVAMRIDRKCLKGIYNYGIELRFKMLLNSLPWSITFMVVYNYLEKKVLEEKNATYLYTCIQ